MNDLNKRKFVGKIPKNYFDMFEINFFFRLAVISASLVSAFLQSTFIEASTENIFASCLSAICSVLVAMYLFRPGVFRSAPMSSIMVLGSSLTLGLGPLVFQTLDWRAVAYNLDSPIMSAALASCSTLLALMTHAIYRGSKGAQWARAAISRALLTPLGTFRAPSELQLWLMGLIGLGSMWATGTFEAAGKVEFGDVGGKFFQALMPFTAAPFLIPMSGNLFGDGGRRNNSVKWPLIGGYFVAVLVVSLARNSRGAFASAVLVLLMSLTLSALMGQLKIRKSIVAYACLGILVATPFIRTLSDLSTAMLINRAERSEISAPELIRRTIETAQNKEAMSAFRSRVQIMTTGYNEIYIRNDFLQRLTLLKFLDLNIRNSSGLTNTQREIAQESFGKKMIGTLPTPLIERLGIDVDKRDLTYSGGDLYRFLAARGQLGGFVTGSSIADGLTIMGGLYWPFIVLFGFAAFILYDALCLPLKGIGAFIAVPALLTIDRILMFGLNGESVAGLLSGILRGYPQGVILYAIMLAATSFLTRGVSRRMPTPISTTSRG